MKVPVRCRKWCTEEAVRKERRKAAELLIKERNWESDASLIDISELAEEVGLDCDDIDIEGSVFFHTAFEMSNGDIAFEGDEISGYLRREDKVLLLDGQAYGCRESWDYDIDLSFLEVWVSVGARESVVESVNSAISEAIERWIDEEESYWEEIDRTHAML